MIPSSLYIPPHTWKIETFPTQMMFGKTGHTQWMNYQLDGALCIVSVICSVWNYVNSKLKENLNSKEETEMDSR